jgi:hypothetical protein
MIQFSLELLEGVRPNTELVSELVVWHLSIGASDWQAARSFREGIYPLVFKTRDLGEADDFMRLKQLRPELDGVDSVVLGKNQAWHGGRVHATHAAEFIRNN